MIAKWSPLTGAYGLGLMTLVLRWETRYSCEVGISGSLTGLLLRNSNYVTHGETLSYIYIYMYLPMRVISTYAGGLVVISSLPEALVIGLQFHFRFSCASVSWFVIHPYPIHPQKTHLFLAQNNPKLLTLWPLWKTISLYFSHRHTGSLKRFPKGPL